MPSLQRREPGNGRVRPRASTSDSDTGGEQFVWPDKIGAQVSEPVALTPSRSAAGNDRGRAVLVTITMSNGSSEPFRFNPFTYSPSVTHTDQPGSRVFDSARLGSDGTSESTILPQEVTDVPRRVLDRDQVGDFQLEVSGGFGTDPAVFVGTF